MAIIRAALLYAVLLCLGAAQPSQIQGNNIPDGGSADASLLTHLPSQAGKPMDAPTLSRGQFPAVAPSLDATAPWSAEAPTLRTHTTRRASYHRALLVPKPDLWQGPSSAPITNSGVPAMAPFLASTLAAPAPAPAAEEHNMCTHDPVCHVYWDWNRNQYVSFCSTKPPQHRLKSGVCPDDVYWIVLVCIFGAVIITCCALCVSCCVSKKCRDWWDRPVHCCCCSRRSVQ